MTYQVGHVDGAYRVYRTHNGIYREWVGPKWPTPREAARYCDLLEHTPEVSPLRDRAEVLTVPVVSASAGSPRGSLPDGDAGQ